MATVSGSVAAGGEVIPVTAEIALPPDLEPLTEHPSLFDRFRRLGGGKE